MKVLLCFLLFCAVSIQDSEALKSGENGVCVVKISTRKTRTRMVTTNKRCGKNKCVVRKVETYTVPEERIACCTGWAYEVSSDSCGSICSTGCIGGRCVAPETCHCDPPATLDPEHKNTCIQPKCEPQCVNSECGPNNTCTCLATYSSYNSTHCFKCDSGYALNDDFTCTPVCDENCINGKCVAPNTCSCLDGYRNVNKSACEPRCDGCINSTCIAPNTCSCLEGFAKLNETACTPKCENCTGDCVAPNVCNCHTGYKNVDGVCKPVCFNCEHGICVAPDECSCEEGFVRNDTNHTSCIKVNKCDKPTEEDVSVTKTKYTRQSIKSKCPKGSSECSKKERENQHTNPKTERCCKKKYTTREKKLMCCPRYEFNKTENICKAQCRLGCENGRCILPDVCQCDPPLILDHNKCVLPVCDPPCVNGKCVNNNTCECNPDYNPVNSTHCAIKCEPGYMNNPVTLECIPKCDSPCINSTCIGPNTCSCIEGYTHKNNFTCIPKCTPMCENAECVAPNTCSCFEGFRLNTGNFSVCSPVCDACDNGDCKAPNVCECHEGYKKKDNICVPVCDQPCQNGVCSAPNVCQCDVGYEIDHKNKFDCLPICEPSCVNASCVSPNTCSCHFGYEAAGSNWTCKPKCGDCENGECIAPNDCRCHTGYTKSDVKCTPICDSPCTNGICSKPNTCNCNEGYKLDSRDKFSCLPICKNRCINAKCSSPNTCSCLTGYEPTKDSHVCIPKCSACHHGECIAPNICQCDLGYNMVDGQCAPICTVPCINGNCSAPNVCTCNDGYEKRSESVCHKPCANSCDHGVCSLHGICRCDEGYRLFNDTCTEIPPVDCETCENNCTMDECRCFDGILCVHTPGVEAEMSNTTGLAGLELSWTLGGAVGLLLLTLLTVVMHRLYRRRKEVPSKEVDDGPGNRYGSVVYTVPDTLIQRNNFNDNGHDDADNDNEDIQKTDRLLTPELTIKDEKL